MTEVIHKRLTTFQTKKCAYNNEHNVIMILSTLTRNMNTNIAQVLANRASDIANSVMNCTEYVSHISYYVGFLEYVLNSITDTDIVIMDGTNFQCVSNNIFRDLVVMVQCMDHTIHLLKSQYR